MPAPSHAELFECLKLAGAHSLAYATLQPGLGYLYRPGLGYLAYAPLGSGRTAVLGDPVAKPGAWPELIALARRELPRVCFVQITEPCARLLAELGCHVNCMGEEIALPLERWNMSGKRRQNLRTLVNRARREGITALELTEWTDAVRAELAGASRAWLNRHSPGGRELRFLLRPAALGPEPGVRTWIARSRAGKLLAFACFDPLYCDGTVTGYAANTLRALSPETEQWRSLLVLAAARQFASEGRASLNLGIAPFLRLDTPAELNPSWFVRLCFWSNTRLYGWLYNFRGIARHKAQYGGEAVPVYFAAPGRFPLVSLVKLLVDTGVSPWRRLAWR